MEITYNIINQIVKWYIYRKVIIKQVKKKNVKYVLIWISIVFAGSMFFWLSENIAYIVEVCLLIFIVWLHEDDGINHIFITVLICKSINLIFNIIGAIVVGIFVIEFYNVMDTNLMFISVATKYILCICFVQDENIKRLKYLTKYKWILALVIGILLISEVLISNNIIFDAEIQLVLKTICTLGFALAVIFSTLYLISKYKLHQETQIIKDENKYLAAELHKSKELMPALISVAEDITNNKKLTDADIQVFLKEIIRLHKEDQQETEQSDMLLKNFCSTGLNLLDRQLVLLLQEAIDKGINFDIFVSRPIDKEIDELGLSQLHLQRTIGDLIRNAFRAIERSKNTEVGQVLLILGCKEDGVFEIRVLDNGEDFPDIVLNSFGKRGVTTGGTGNGLADLVAYVDKVNASVKLEEFVVGHSSFVKGLSIIFDHKNVYQLDTTRRLKRNNLQREVHA